MFRLMAVLMGPNDGNGEGGDPEGVSDLETGDKKAPTTEELSARMAALEAENKAMKEERGQLLTTLASVEKLVPARKQKEEDDDQEELEPVVAKRLTKAEQRMEAQFAAFQGGVLDRLDHTQFMQTAANMGMTEEEFENAEKEYQAARRAGMAVTDSSGVKRPVTRQDLLDLKLGREVRQARLKEAPTKQFESLRERLGANAGMENPGGGQRVVKGLNLEELKKEPEATKRVQSIGKALDGVEI